jgi:hypothetical protein
MENTRTASFDLIERKFVRNDDCPKFKLVN